jgi:hypothetical protein
VLVGSDVVAKKRLIGGIPGDRSILDKVRAKLAL